MEQTNPPQDVPALSRDVSFWGMTATQFLGAFNDNLFKQIVLLICVDHLLRPGGEDYQSIALALFAIPFVLLSGFAGYLSDRMSKRRIVVLCKVAEILVMLLGGLAFAAGQWDADRQLVFLFVVLFLMSTQSAFFGPAKYGILPELLHERDLPQANGIIQMTTFVAIIFGMALAGYVKDMFRNELWMVSGICIGIAILGTATSLLLRRTPIAHPGLPFQASALAINPDTRKLLRHDRPLLGVLLVSSLFWFVGGVIQPAVNLFGKVLLQLGDSRTSVLGACMGVGIALGCLLAGKASHKQVNFKLVTVGAWGLIVCLFLLALFGPNNAPAAVEKVSLPELMIPASRAELLARLTLTALGAFAGLFIVPLQVFMQARPPADQKGRMIGAMNLVNWIGIVLAAAFLAAMTKLLGSLELPINWIFPALALLLVPVAILYRPHDEMLR